MNETPTPPSSAPGNGPAEPPPVQYVVLCPQCGAAVQPELSKCWLCGVSVTPTAFPPGQLPPILPHGLHAQAPRPQSRSVFDGLMTGILVGIVALTILVAVSVAAQDPGLLVPFCIIALPPLMIAGAQGLLHVGSTGRANPGKMVAGWLVSLVITFAIVIVLTAAAVVLTIVYCFSAMSGAH